MRLGGVIVVVEASIVAWSGAWRRGQAGGGSWTRTVRKARLEKEVALELVAEA